MFQRLIKFCAGRHTAFAIWFASMGTLLAWFHRLDGSYVGLVTALQGYVMLHSAKEDYFKKDDHDDHDDHDHDGPK